MGSLTTPRVRCMAQNTQLTYNLSRRVNNVQVYPVRSPQGATILIYAHENGVTLVWRGGRRLKPADKPTNQGKRNGATEDVVMIIDSDDDEEAAAGSRASPAFVDKPHFEDAVDTSAYLEIIQTLDLSLGTSVLNVAVAPITPCASKDVTEAGYAPILSEKMVFAVSCVTNDVYIVTLSLTPPSPESKARAELETDLLAGTAGSGAWGESLVHLGGQTRPSDGLAMNVVLPKQSSESPPGLSHVVVASRSRQASGTLHLWTTPIGSLCKKQDRPLEPLQTEYLPHLLNSISFNPTHTTQLLTVSSRHAVRIYDFAAPLMPPDLEADGPFPSQGSWLLSLYQPFARTSTLRRPMLDAAWIMQGRAIFALLADGMWGIWDVDAVSPSPPVAAISNKLKPGVQGAALTVFSVSGYVEGTSSLRSIIAQSRDGSSGEFAPMTPHTRRQATATLSTATTYDRLSSVKGGIRTLALPKAARALRDESLVLWIGGQEHVCVIPAVSKFWESQLRKGHGGGVNLFSGAQPTRMIKLLDLSMGLLGERCCGATPVVAEPAGNSRQTDPDGGLPVDVVIQGESRIVIVRQGEEGPGTKIGGVVEGRKRRLFSRNEGANAIIVRGGSDRLASMPYNLGMSKPRTLRLPSLAGFQDEGPEEREELALEQSPAARLGLDFTKTLNAAADASADIARDVELEMLDIMEIDRALDSMEDSRGSGRKKVFFEDG